MNKKNKNNSNKIGSIELLIYIFVIMLTITIYLINFTTIGLDLGFNVKPNVLMRKEVSYGYQNLCEAGTRPTKNYKCRTNKKILNSITIIDTSIFKKNKFLKYFHNISTIYFIADEESLSEDEIEKKLKYLNVEKITVLYIDKYSDTDLDFLDKLNNLESLSIIEAENLNNIEDNKNLANLDFVHINDIIIDK